MSVSKEMPKYQSHKIVWGLKIKGIHKSKRVVEDLSDDAALLSFVEEGYSDKKVSKEYVEKHKPKVGGYYVVYEGGYESWSPGDVFEAGNTRIS